MKPLTILLTGCGAPGTSGTVMALRQNPDNRPVRIIGVDVNPDTPGQLLVDAFAPILPPENVDYRSRLLDVCQRHKVDLVIPQTTGEVGRLSSLIPWFYRHGIRIMASRAAWKANDKWACLKIAAPLGCCAEAERVFSAEGLYWAVRSREPSPAVVKPLVSCGSRGVRIVTSSLWTRDRFLAEKPSGLECTLESLVATLCVGAPSSFPGLVVMDYLPGPEYSVDCFRGEYVQMAVPRIRTAMRDGISTNTTILDKQVMASDALTLGRFLGLTGVYGVQFKENAEGVPCLLEVNPRVQGTMAASVLAGANLIWMGVLEAMGESVTEEPAVRIGTRCVRHWVVSEMGRA